MKVELAVDKYINMLIASGIGLFGVFFPVDRANNIMEAKAESSDN